MAPRRETGCLSGGRYVGERSRQVNDGRGGACCQAPSEGYRAVNEDTMAAAANRGVRRRGASLPGALRPGSDAHKIAFCRMLLDTHDPYRPAAIAWPDLDAEA